MAGMRSLACLWKNPLSEVAMRSTVHKANLAALAFLLSAGVGSGTTFAEPSEGSRHGDPRIRGIDLERSTIPELQDAMDHHRLTSVELTLFYLDRIEDLNPEVHAVIATNPVAIVEAVFSDIRRATHDLRGPMDGIPVLLKDNVDTREVVATAGSEALLDARGRDAFLVTRLRAAGAVIMAKANLSEWANFRSFFSSSGWSGVGG